MSESINPMKFVIAVHGTRGDVEPCATAARELQRRGHSVQMAVPPNLIGFVESVGLNGVAYGPDSGIQINQVAAFIRNLTRAQNPLNLARAGRELFVEGWAEMGTTLAGLADGADLLVTGQTYHGVAANVAEYHGIPVAAVHHFPVQVNGQTGVPWVSLPSSVTRSTMRAALWTYSQVTKSSEADQRRELGLPKASVPALTRMLAGGSLELQAYDQALFPGLAAEWNDLRPFTGALTLDLPGENEDDIAEWIGGGEPPIYFGFGSTPVQSREETIAMISSTCAELGERALIYSGGGESSGVALPEHVKLVGQMNYTNILPRCRAAVHHGGAGTTAASLRAGLPTLILYEVADQPIWAAQVKRLNVGSARRFSRINRKSLVTELHSILSPECVARARAIAPKMIAPADAAKTAADLLESSTRQRSAAPSADERSPR